MPGKDTDFAADLSAAAAVRSRSTGSPVCLAMRSTYTAMRDRSLAPGDLSDLAMLPDIVPSGPRLVLADRNYWSPLVTEDLARDGVTLWAPFRSATYGPTPERSVVLGRVRYRIETTFAQLVERCQAKQV